MQQIQRKWLIRTLTLRRKGRGLNVIFVSGFSFSRKAFRSTLRSMEDQLKQSLKTLQSRRKQNQNPNNQHLLLANIVVRCLSVQNGIKLTKWPTATNALFNVAIARKHSRANPIWISMKRQFTWVWKNSNANIVTRPSVGNGIFRFTRLHTPNRRPTPNRRTNAAFAPKC